MAGKKIGLVLALDGEKEFKSAIKAVKEEVKLYADQLKNIDTAFAENKNSMDALERKQESLTKKQEAYKKQLDAAKDGLDHAKDQYKQQADALDKLKDKLNDAERELKEMKEAGDDNTEAYRKQKEKVDELKDAVSKQSDNLNTAQSRVNNWTREVNNAESALDKCNGELKDNDKYLDEAKNSADGCATSIDNFGNKVGDAANDTEKLNISLKDMVKAKLVDMAGDALRNLGEKAIDAAKYVVEVGSSFEAQMSKVEAISGASKAEMQQLTDVATEMGRTTKFSATEAGEGLEYMAVAGWKTQDMVAGLPGILYLAAASGEELGTTSDIVTDALTAFGASAEESGHLADIMAAASSNANTNVSLMGETFKYAAPVAGALGYSMEDTAEAIGLMANAGIKGSSAGTSLRSIITRLSTDAGASSTKLGALGVLTEELGVQFFNTDGSARDLNDVLTDAREVWGTLTEEEQVNYANTIAGKNAMSGWLALMNAAPSDIEKLEGALGNCDGAAERMAATMQDNLSGKLTTLNSALEGLGIAVYNYVSGPLQGVVSGVTDIINGITESLPTHRTELEKFIESVQKTNEEVSKSISNAQQTVANAEAKVAQLETAKTFLQGVLDNCKQFNETDLSGTASKVDTDLNTAETAFTDLNEAAGYAVEGMEGVNDVALDGSSLNEASIKDPLSELGVAADDAKKAVEGVDDAKLDGSTLNEAAIKDPLSELGVVAGETKKAVEEVDDAKLDGSALNESSIKDPLGEIDEAAGTAKEAIEGVDDTVLNGSALNESSITDPLGTINEEAGKAKESVEGVDDTVLDGSSLNETSITTPLGDIKKGAEDAKSAVSDTGNATIDTKNIDTASNTLVTDMGDVGKAAEEAKGSVSDTGNATIDDATVKEGTGKIVSDINEIGDAAKSAKESVSDTSNATVSDTKIKEGTEAIVTDMGAAGQAAEEALKAIEKPGSIKPTTISSKVAKAAENIVTAEESVKTGAEEADTAIGNIGSNTEKIDDATRALGYMKDATGECVIITDEFTKTQITNTVQRLKDTVPELAEAWNANTGELKLTNEQLLQYIDNAEKTVKAKAYAQALEEAWKAVADSELAEAQAQSAVNAAMEQANDAMQNGADLVMQYGSDVGFMAAQTGIADGNVQAATNSLNDAKENTEQARDVVNQMTKALEDMGYNVEGATVTVDEYTDKVAEDTGVTEQAIDKKELLYKAFADLIEIEGEAEEATGALTDKQKESVQAFQEMTDATINDLVELADKMGMSAGEFAEWCQEQVDGVEQLKKDYESLSDSITNSLSNYVNTLDVTGEEGEKSLQNLTKSYQEHLQEIRTWGENMKTLAGMIGKGFSQELYDMIAEEGFEKSKDTVDLLVKSITDNGQQFDEAGQECIQAMMDGLTEPGIVAEGVTSLTSIGQEYAEAQKNGFVGTLDDYKQSVFDFTQQGAEAGKEASEDYDAVGENAGSRTAEGIEDQERLIESTSEAVVKAGKEAAEKGSKLFDAVGKNAMQSLSRGMQEVANGGISSPINRAQRIVENAIKSAKTESQNFKNAGKSGVEAYANAIKNNAHLAVAQALAAATKSGDAVKAREYMYKNAGYDAMSSYANGISGNAGSAYSAAGNAAGNAAGAPYNYYRSFYSAGAYIVSGLAEGISDYAWKVANAAASAAQAGINAANKKLVVASPSKVFYQIGKYVDEGLAQGIEKNQKLIEDATRKAAQASIETANRNMEFTSRLDIVGAERLNELTRVNTQTADTATAIQTLTTGLKALSNLAESLMNPSAPNVTVMIGNREFKGYIVNTAVEGMGQMNRSMMRGVGA